MSSVSSIQIISFYYFDSLISFITLLALFLVALSTQRSNENNNSHPTWFSGQMSLKQCRDTPYVSKLLALYINIQEAAAALESNYFQNAYHTVQTKVPFLRILLPTLAHTWMQGLTLWQLFFPISTVALICQLHFVHSSMCLSWASL